MPEERSQPFEASRRALLGGVGATVGGLALTGRTDAIKPQFAGADQSPVVLRQGDRCISVTPPEQFASETNGASDPGSGPYYSSIGTEGLQQDRVSFLLLYDGPNGLSLVIVHGSRDSGPSGGGAVTFEMTGILANGKLVVKDDYLEPDSGESVPNYYDTWQTNGMIQVIDRTWGNEGTNGGVFRGPPDAFSVTIDPAFNEQAALFGEQYDGTVESWQFVVPNGDDVQRLSLDMSAPVTVETGTCNHEANTAETAPEIKTVEFKGCRELWLVFEKLFDGTIEAAVKTTTGWHPVEFTGDDLQRVPGQFGEYPCSSGGSRGMRRYSPQGHRPAEPTTTISAPKETMMRTMKMRTMTIDRT
jgi:hypothetical protein